MHRSRCRAPAHRPSTRTSRALVDKVSAQAIEIRHDIHQHPELSNREVRTAELVAKELRALGLKVTTGIARTGVVGVLQGKGPGPVIAVRADMDALPVTEASDLPFKSTARATYVGREVGVSHACGHDIHVAAALGAASVLSSLRDRINGTVMFIFQPAEEGPPPGEKGGAGPDGRGRRLQDAQAGRRSSRCTPTALLRTQPEMTNGLGRLSYTPGPAFAAATKWTAIVRGRSAHGAAPHLSVDPIVTASQIVLALQTLRSRILPPLSANVITVGIIRGGERNNIIPAEVYLEGTIRTFDTAIQDTLEERMRDIFDGTTKAAHATFELSFDRAHPLTTNDLALTERMVPSPAARRRQGERRRRPAGDRIRRLLVLQQHRAGLLLQVGRGAGGKDVGRPPHADVLRGRQGGAGWHSSPEHARPRLLGVRHALTRLLFLLLLSRNSLSACLTSSLASIRPSLARALSCAACSRAEGHRAAGMERRCAEDLRRDLLQELVVIQSPGRSDIRRHPVSLPEVLVGERTLADLQTEDRGKVRDRDDTNGNRRGRILEAPPDAVERHGGCWLRRLGRCGPVPEPSSRGPVWTPVDELASSSRVIKRASLRLTAWTLRTWTSWSASVARRASSVEF